MAKCPYLIDLSGNNHHARCFNFAWEQMSGVGGYKVPPMINKRGWYEYTSHYGNNGTYSYSGTTLHITKLDNFMNIGDYISYNPTFENNPLNASYDGKFITTHSMRLKISGLSDCGKKFAVTSTAYLQDSIMTATSSGDISLLIDGDGVEYSAVTQDGIYTIKENTYAAKSDLYNKINYPIFKIPNKNGEQLDVDITIEILPDYPGALVTDGVDDYAYVDKVPPLVNESGFTFVAKRNVLEKPIFGSSAADTYGLMTDRSASIITGIAFESTTENPPINAFYSSFGGGLYTVEEFPAEYGQMTSTKVNGLEINKGTEPFSQSDWVMFKKNKNLRSCGKYAFYSIALFDKDLEDNEIDWIKENLC